MSRHVLAIADLSDEEIESILRRAEEMEAALDARRVPSPGDGTPIPQSAAGCSTSRARGPACRSRRRCGASVGP